MSREALRNALEGAGKPIAPSGTVSIRSFAPKPDSGEEWRVALQVRFGRNLRRIWGKGSSSDEALASAVLAVEKLREQESP